MIWSEWTEESEYPDLDDTADWEWAWQFLRRNPEYQSDWEHELTLAKREGKELGEALLSQPYFSLTPTDEGRGRLYYLNKYGLYELTNPATSRPGRVTFEPWYGITKEASAIELVELPLLDHQIAYVFDLTKDLAGQLQLAKATLKPLIKQRILAPGVHRRRRDRFRNYLRMLDAESSGVSRREIAKELFPLEDCDHPMDSGYQKVSHGLSAAKLLRDSHFRALTHGWTAKDDVNSDE